MDLNLATKRMSQILDQERRDPTVDYEAAAKNELAEALATGIVVPRKRGHRPREIQRDPSKFRFRSENYDLLASLFSRVTGENRVALVSLMLCRLHQNVAIATTLDHHFDHASFDGSMSELPLIAEFCLRQGFSRNFLSSLAEAHPSVAIGTVLLELEDMLDFNFDICSEDELEYLGLIVRNLTERPICGEMTQENRAFFCALCDSVAEGCRKAAYLYAAAALRAGENLEVNRDKQTVESFINRLGFSTNLVRSLDHAEKLYRDGTSPFDFKACMGDLRSFMENLHVESAARKGRPPQPGSPREWGESTRFLREQGILTQQEENFAASLYTLMSDQAIHRLFAEREHARVSRNVAIEYGLLLLSKISKSS